MEHFITFSCVLILFLRATLVHCIPNYKFAIILEVGTDWPFDLHRSGPAIEIGKEKFRDIIEDRLNVTFIEIYKKQNLHQCTIQGFGSIVARLFYEDGVNGFLGPGKFCFLELFR